VTDHFSEGSAASYREFRKAKVQSIRLEMFDLLNGHPPYLAPLTAAQLQARLSNGSCLSLRTVQWHLRELRLSLRDAQ
jgi:hypothetical protein